MEDKSKRRLRPSPATVIATIALVFAIGGVAKSAIPDENGYYAGCYYIDPDPDFSYMYVIDPATDSCDTGAGEKLMTWSKYGVEATKLQLAKQHNVSADGSLNDVTQRIAANKQADLKFLDSIQSISLKGVKFKAKKAAKALKKDDIKALSKQLVGLQKSMKEQNEATKGMLEALGDPVQKRVEMFDTLRTLVQQMQTVNKNLISALEGSSAP